MGVCEQRMLLQAEYGARRSSSSDAARHRGTEAHGEFYREARGVQSSRGDSRCFIATAVYGESDETQTLRHFRDEVLLRFGLGVWVVELYYLAGPAIAGRIAQSNRARVTARFLLKPCVWLASAILVWSRRVG
jgi:hypothetical protein